MFEALLDFAEHTVFSRSRRVAEQALSLSEAVRAMAELLLTFSDRNPGITRVLLGEAVMGEKADVRERAGRYFERAETELRQLFREAALDPERATAVPASVAAGLVLAFVEARMSRFSRSGFRHSPLSGWEDQWRVIESGLFGRPGE